jgi:ubiquinone/menaquinone biosynthesis C-methylase UbiE
MKAMTTHSSETYWNRVAETYDDVFPGARIGQVQRRVVWRELEGIFHSGERILELNCGTGIDALHLAQNGVRVLACDLAPGMIEMAQRRVGSSKFGELIQFRVLPTEKIAGLGDDGPFDGAFSNFSGLNHVKDLAAVAETLARLLKPGSRVLLCMAGHFAPAEMAWYLAQGNLRGAVRRFTRVTDDEALQVYYPTVGALTRTFAPSFHLREWKGIGVVLPSCLEHAARRFPAVFKGLAKADQWLGQVPVLRGLADCVLLQFELVR